MWHLRPAPSGREVIDLDHPATSAALPTDSDAETWSIKRRRKEAPRPSSSSTNQPLSELDKQRQESVATALQLYSNPKEAGIKLLLPSAMDLTDNPFTHCPTEQLATSCLHSQSPSGPHLQFSGGSWMVYHPCKTRGTHLPALTSRRTTKASSLEPTRRAPWLDCERRRDGTPWSAAC